MRVVGLACRVPCLPLSHKSGPSWPKLVINLYRIATAAFPVLHMSVVGTQEKRRPRPPMSAVEGRPENMGSICALSVLTRSGSRAAEFAVTHNTSLDWRCGRLSLREGP